MKTNRLVALVLSVIIIGATLCGCAQQSAEEPDASTSAVSAVSAVSSASASEPAIDMVPPVDSSAVLRYQLEAAPLIKPNREQKDAAAATVASGANRFALRLSNVLVLEKEPEENFICSPYSVWLPLAAMLNATDEAHREAFLSALDAAGVTEDDVNRAASRMLYDLTLEFYRDHERHSPLSITNAVFVSKDVTLNRDFAQLYLDFYRGEVLSVDFSSEQAVLEVNRWASENTNGLIPEIIGEFPTNTLAVIANSIYFSDQWNSTFNSDQTAEDIFHAPNGDTTAMFMKEEADGLWYYEDDNLQAIKLYMTYGGAMQILLPKDGNASGLLASLDESYLQTIQDGTSERTGLLLLPRFDIDSGSFRLDDALRSLGVPLFDDPPAGLPGLLEESIPVEGAQCLQRAVINVDELGTTAATVTLTIPESGGDDALIPTEPFTMICDKPFVFLLYGRTTDSKNQILFTGVVNRPESLQ